MSGVNGTAASESILREAERLAFRALNTFMVPAVRAGLGSPLPLGGGVVILETTGRRSGKLRQVPLVALRAGSTVKVSTVRSDSQWIANLEADPSAAVWLNGKRSKVTARVDRGSLTVVTLTVHD